MHFQGKKTTFIFNKTFNVQCGRLVIKTIHVFAYCFNNIPLLTYLWKVLNQIKRLWVFPHPLPFVKIVNAQVFTRFLMNKKFKWKEECVCFVLVINFHQEVEEDVVVGGEFKGLFILFLLLQLLLLLLQLLISQISKGWFMFLWWVNY